MGTSKTNGQYIGAANFTRGAFSSASAFTLIELLVVVFLIVLLMYLMTPLMNFIKGGKDLTKSASDIQGTLELARSYAMAKNTYVYVGLQEVDVVQANLITPNYTPGVGRIALAAVVSTTGIRPYTNTPGALTSNIAPLGKLLYFDNLHITNSVSLTNGNLAIRPSNNCIDLSGVSSKTTFAWPVTGTANYSFSNIVIEFSPRGIPTVQTNSSCYDSSIKPFLEIALLPSHGNTATSSSNQAAIQINGITGAVQIYRP